MTTAEIALATAHRREQCRTCANEPACGHWMEPRIETDEDGEETCLDCEERGANPFA